MNWSDREKKKEVLILILLNISALSYLLFMLFGVIIPMVIWIFTRDKYAKIDEVGKKLLNFEITMCLLVGYLFAMMFIIPAFHLSYSNKRQVSFI